jgi:hypothetical protein
VGVIGGFIVGSLIGAGIGNSAWNAQLAGVPNPEHSYDILRFPAVPLAKVLVLGPGQSSAALRVPFQPPTKESRA